MHPKPEETERPSSSSGSHKSEQSTKENGDNADPLVDTNLIQLDA
jgi:hypothetical protein